MRVRTLCGHSMLNFSKMPMDVSRSMMATQSSMLVQVSVSSLSTRHPVQEGHRRRAWPREFQGVDSKQSHESGIKHHDGQQSSMEFSGICEDGGAWSGIQDYFS